MFINGNPVFHKWETHREPCSTAAGLPVTRCWFRNFWTGVMATRYGRPGNLSRWLIWVNFPRVSIHEDTEESNHFFLGDHHHQIYHFFYVYSVCIPYILMSSWVPGSSQSQYIWWLPNVSSDAHIFQTGRISIFQKNSRIIYFSWPEGRWKNGKKRPVLLVVCWWSRRFFPATMDWWHQVMSIKSLRKLM